MKKLILLLALLTGCTAYEPVFTYQYVRFRDGSQRVTIYQDKKITKDSVILYSEHILNDLDSINK